MTIRLIAKYALASFLLYSPFSNADFYIGGTVGYSWAADGDTSNISQEAENTIVDIDDDPSSMLKGVFVGYQAKWLGVEVDYARVMNGTIAIRGFDRAGKDAFINSSIEIDRLSLSILPLYSVNENWDVYGRVGYGYSEVSYQYKATRSFKFRDDRVEHINTEGLLGGVGIRFHNEHYDMRVEAQRDFTGIHSIGPHMDSLNLGFGYRF